jgi:3-oxoacyl-[acyl-carrier protein] reductase
MDLELNGKIAFITGSSKGIGLGIAAKLADEGCTVVLNGRDAKRLADATEKIEGSIGIQGDMSKPKECLTIINQIKSDFGRLDILVCNVGNGSLLDREEGSPEDWQVFLSSNLTPATNTIWAATDILCETRGVVICVTSICGLEALGCPSAYAASKAAIESFVKNSSRKLGKMGVRINSIAPGNIMFDGSVWEKKIKEDQNSVKKLLAEEVPLGRLGTPDDVANAVAFLASSISAFITGTTIIVDGGQTRS